MAQESSLLETSLIALVDTLVERVEPTPLETYVDDMFSLGEVLGDTKVPRAMTDFLDYNHLHQRGEHIKGREIAMEGQVVTHVEPMVEEDEKSYFGLTTDLKHTDAQTITKATILPDVSSLQAYIDGTYNIARLPLHNGEGDVGLSQQILCTDKVNVMR